MPVKLLIIGGGAAGFMAAITAASMNAGAEIIIAEKSLHLLAKVKVSGGGRCNVTHDPHSIEQFAQNYPRGQRFLKKILHAFGPEDTVNWFESRGVKLKTEADGRMFPVSNNSESIINCLQNEAEKFGVKIHTKLGVESFNVIDNKGSNVFNVQFSDGKEIRFDKILLATGGYPKASGFDWIKSHGLEIVEPSPSLFTFNSPGNSICALMGVSMPLAKVKVTGSKLEWTGPLLITHWGFSGPAVLKLSAWGAIILKEKQYKFDIFINWISEFERNEVREAIYSLRDNKSKSLVVSNSKFNIPARLWKYLTMEAGIGDDKIWAEMSNKSLDSLLVKLIEQAHHINGKTTFKEEFVTSGGVALSEIDHTTMESKKIKGLYFAGELIDVDGITGGFNFQNAWTTGYIAGKAMAE